MNRITRRFLLIATAFAVVVAVGCQGSDKKDAKNQGGHTATCPSEAHDHDHPAPAQENFKIDVAGGITVEADSGAAITCNSHDHGKPGHKH